MTTHIYIVEDHPVLQQILQEHLKRLPGLTVCGVATTAEEALTTLPDAKADLVIIDVSLPGISGIALVKQLRELQPCLRCLMLSGHQTEEYAQRALEAGACGYIAKGSPSEFAITIEQVLNGELYLSEDIRQKLGMLPICAASMESS